MNAVVCAPINTLPATATIPILPQGHALWGILEAIEPIGDGLLRVQISAQEYLVDESLHEKLAPLVGQRITAVHVGGQWGAGALA